MCNGTIIDGWTNVGERKMRVVHVAYYLHPFPAPNGGISGQHANA
jgi:hypothetical protein